MHKPAGTINPIIRLKGTSKHIVMKAMTQTVLKILSSKENSFGSPINFFPLRCFPKISTGAYQTLS